MNQEPSPNPQDSPKDAAASSAQRSGKSSSAKTHRGSRKRKSWLLILAGVVLLGVAAAGFKFAYPAIKVSRGRQSAADAEALLRRGKLEEAGRKIKVALQLAPREESVLRAAGHYCSAVGDPSGINYFRMLIGASKATFNDRTNLIALGHATMRLGPAREELKTLLTADSNNPVVLRLLVENHLLAKDTERAVKTAAYALKGNPTNAWFQFMLGSLLVDDPRGVKYRDEGRRLLLSLAVGSSDQKYAAENRLALSAGLSRAELVLLQRQIESRTNRTINDEVIIYDLRRRQDTNQVDALVREGIQRYVQEQSVDGMSNVAAWGASHRQFRAVVDSLPLNIARTNRNLALLRASSLAELKEWPALQTLLDDPQSQLGPVLTPCFRARIAMGTGKQKEAEAHFRTLLELKEIVAGDAQLLALQAEMAGLPHIAIDIYQRLAGDPQWSVEAASQCVRLTRQIEDTTLVREVLRRLSSIFSADDGIAAETAWLDLVANDRVTEAWGTLSRLHEKAPTNPTWRACLAFAEFRMGRQREALALLQHESLKGIDLPPRLAAVQAVVLGANDLKAEARKVARTVELARLRPEERALVKDLL